jgi:hypothetical protein
MTNDHGEVLVRDLGSTNGIRINGQRVEFGRLRAGDELSIAHIRYRLDNGQAHDVTLADPREKPQYESFREAAAAVLAPAEAPARPYTSPPPNANALAAAVRQLLPSGVADRCLIQVIVRNPDEAEAGGRAEAENLQACRPDSSP